MFVKRKPLGSLYRSLVRGQSNGDDETGLWKHLTDQQKQSLLTSLHFSKDRWLWNLLISAWNKGEKQIGAYNTGPAGQVTLFTRWMPVPLVCQPLTALATAGCFLTSSSGSFNFQQAPCWPSAVGLIVLPSLLSFLGSAAYGLVGGRCLCQTNCAIPVTLKWVAPIFNLEGISISLILQHLDRIFWENILQSKQIKPCFITGLFCKDLNERIS